MIKGLEWENNQLKLLDQTKLPDKLDYIVTDSYQRVAESIRRLEVRGAPAIGIAAAYATVLGLQEVSEHNLDWQLHKVTDELRNTRPTAVNLGWALDRMVATYNQNKSSSEESIINSLLQEAKDIEAEDKDMCTMIGKFGADLLKQGATILTHCNTGSLVTGGYGTALGIIYEAHFQDKGIHVYADETRPLLQGARLTAWELEQEGIDVTLITDNMAAHVLRDKGVDAVIVGADRITANGDVANKIGTYGVAVLANHHDVPFYVAAPSSTFDFSLSSGTQIPIEQRSADEVRHAHGKLIAPKNIQVYNPAFDVTPNQLVSAIITEVGVFRPPYDKLRVDVGGEK